MGSHHNLGGSNLYRFQGKELVSADPNASAC
ncbi:hypothetical protein SAMN05192573_107159 [Mucilaginibacter gossypii]|uniref:Uncharacterized protein n=1 Tax=Mucilaginibacter gossypii TaxID=551996 RepID=A0A1G8ACX0_9SPHI|nr:hypothetical protein SAMN05192573_107159 [Mucilaginibacter gossypii]